MYSSIYKINNNIKTLIEKTKMGDKKLNYTTKMYIMKKIISEIERLTKMLFIIPEALQEDVMEEIKYLKYNLDNINKIADNVDVKKVIIKY